jgi:hypothetical protein
MLSGSLHNFMTIITTIIIVAVIIIPVLHGGGINV